MVTFLQYKVAQWLGERLDAPKTGLRAPPFAFFSFFFVVSRAFCTRIITIFYHNSFLLIFGSREGDHCLEC